MANATTARAGPWKGVWNTTEPYDDQPDKLVNLTQAYIADVGVGSSIYARPGATVTNGATQLGSSTRTGQGVYCHIGNDGTIYNFVVVTGKVYRASSDLSTYTDVTPTNVTLDATAHVYMTSFNGDLIVNGAVGKPWVGTSLGSTPITATEIEYHSGNVLFSIGTVDDTKVKNVAFTYALLGIQYSKASTETFPAGAGSIPAGTWGIFRQSINAAGTIASTPGAANATTGYGTEVAAIADVPATPAGQWNAGYFTVLANGGGTWTGGVNALAGGAIHGGNLPAVTTNYYAGQGDPWVAFGQPEVYSGSLFFILSSVAGVSMRSAIAWSEPDSANTGWQQTNFDNEWTLEQTGSAPIYVLFATNNGLYYARDLSWGLLTGIPGINFQTTANHDAVSENIGCVSPASVDWFGQYIYFTDNIGRPHRFAIGSKSVEPLWKQLRTPTTTQITAGRGAPANVSLYTWGIVEPNLNVYICGAWPTATGNNSPSTFYVFDAPSGVYLGTWSFVGSTGSKLICQMDMGGVLRGTNNQPQLVMLGERGTTNTRGFVWLLSLLSDNVWTDDGQSNLPVASTQYLGFSLDKEQTVTQVRAEVGTTSAVSLTAITPYASTSVGTVTPPTSVLGTYRATWTPTQGVKGRGVQLQLTPTSTASQWLCSRIEADLVESDARVDAQ